MDPVSITLMPERPVVRKDSTTEIDLVVEVSCHTEDAHSAPKGLMNLCLVIDRSGSMGGGKIEAAKKGSIDIFRRLDAGGLLTVVTFDADVSVIINPQTPRDEVEPKINAISLGGMTNLSLGWYQGLLELQTHMQDAHFNRLFLLSDGMANRGETKRAVFAETAARARDVGITASTIGIGDSYQEDILETIASSSGGRFWNINTSDIEDIIEEEFEGALTVILDRPRVSLSLPQGVRVSKELNTLRKVSQRYRLRPLQGDDVFNFAVRLEIDPKDAQADELTVAAALYDAERSVCSGDATISLGTAQQVAAATRNPLVQSVVQQFEMSQSGEAMLDDMDVTNAASMREMLTAEIARLREVEVAMEQVDIGMINERRNLEMGHLGHNILSKQISALVAELIEPYSSDNDVRRFFTRFRKNLMREQQRVKMRRHIVEIWDDEVPIALEAIALIDRLIEKFPTDADQLNRMRERFREYLEA
jgi:Ca-activated chloride channel homolog